MEPAARSPTTFIHPGPPPRLPRLCGSSPQGLVLRSFVFVTSICPGSSPNFRHSGAGPGAGLAGRPTSSLDHSLTAQTPVVAAATGGNARACHRRCARGSLAEDRAGGDGARRNLAQNGVRVAGCPCTVPRGIDQGPGVRRRVQEPVHRERVLRGAATGVELGEGTDPRGVEAGAHVVQGGAQALGCDVEPALVLPGVLAHRGAAGGSGRQGLAIGVVADRVGEGRLVLRERACDVAVEIGSSQLTVPPALTPRRSPAGHDEVGVDGGARDRVGDPDHGLARPGIAVGVGARGCRQARVGSAGRRGT